MHPFVKAVVVDIAAYRLLTDATMSLKLAQYLIDQGVDHITEGKNVSHGRGGHINIKCPFCADDPAYHMGINIVSGKWGCWRDPSHRGEQPHRLLRAVLRIPWHRVEELAKGGSATRASFEDMMSWLTELDQPLMPELAAFEFIPDNEFAFPRLFGSTQGLKYQQYLEKRGYTKGDLPKVAKQYDLRFSSTGTWNSRLILPIRINQQLLGWTARAVVPAQLRYKSHPPGDAVKRIVYGHDECLEGGRALVITEGPFDRVKFDFYAQTLGVRALAILGVAVTEAQIVQIVKLAERFDNLWLLLDDDALDLSLVLQRRLSLFAPKILQLPSGKHDPDQLTAAEICNMCKTEFYYKPR